MWLPFCAPSSSGSFSDEFTRAVYVATGLKLTRHVVNTVFKIFDEDHDDKLSYKEFIGVMKDRLHRSERVRQPGSEALCHTGVIQTPFISLL